MIKSKLFRINLYDFIKGLVVAIFTAVLTCASEAFVGGDYKHEIKRCGLVALSALCAYLVKQMSTNSNGELFTKEK